MCVCVLPPVAHRFLSFFGSACQPLEVFRLPVVAKECSQPRPQNSGICSVLVHNSVRLHATLVKPHSLRCLLRLRLPGICSCCCSPGCSSAHTVLPTKP